MQDHTAITPDPAPGSGVDRPPAGREPRHAPWLLFLLSGCLLSAAAVIIPDPVGRIFWEAVPLSAVIAMIVGIRWHRPSPARPWWLMTAGLAVWAVSDIVWTTILVTTGADAFWTSALYMLAYPSMAIGLAQLARGHSRRLRNGANIDAAFVTISAAYLCWTLVFNPHSGRTSLTGGLLVGAAFYLAFDALVIFMTARLWMLHGSRNPVYLMLGVGFCGLMTADTSYLMTQAGTGFGQGNALEDMGWLTWAVLMGAAALHPYMNRTGPAAGTGRVTLLRGAVFLAITCATPLTALITFRSGRVDRVDIALQLIPLMFLLGFLIVRLIGLTSVAVRRARELDRRTAALTASLREQEKLQELLTYQALHDPLTGLANRALFNDRLGQLTARRGPAGHAVLLLDLDGFKDVNDTRGHPVGDALLVQTGHRLRDLLREADTLARLGGDEFAILLEDVTRDQAADIASRVVDALAVPFTVEGHHLQITTSVGLYLVDGHAQAADVMRDADLALYAAKAAGKDQISVFHPDLRVEQLDHARIVAGLRRALDDDSLTLAYQPVVNMDDGRIRAVEALLRWNTPDGPIPPDAFIGIAEETGLIVPIGERVLRRACHEARRWHEDHGIAVTVNVSSRQLRRADFTATVLAALRDSGLPGEALILEITETALLASGPKETARITASLSALREHGVRVAIDDFGTGYSSLAYLMHLPVDVVKIDGAFTAFDPSSARQNAFVQAILHLCESLRLPAIAEQIETTEQHEFLRGLRCPLGQGYLFARPLPAEALDALLSGDDPLTRQAV
ncbi:putative bifunctional diguanylate cyclase/phosphodiesterase [Spirillospora albida]|uniref:putative bifunctional diguanylate cyclase/phosphodiesterase n=1 Tax=Spirillospora albida TaxID=58123 RepID=UPI00068C0606|nr:EAL domain-containing protein [Spirillospora albida]